MSLCYCYVVMLVEAKSCGWVGHGSCLLEIKERCILAPSVLGPSLQLPAHKLIPPNSFYETLNKGKLSPINYKHFSFWSGKQFQHACLPRMNALIKKENGVELTCFFQNSRKWNSRTHVTLQLGYNVLWIFVGISSKRKEQQINF